MANLFTKFRIQLAKHGLESFGKFYGVYRGFVESNEDATNCGKLQLRVPQIYGSDPLKIWAYPRGMVAGKKSGIYWLPSKDDPVYVSFENGDTRYPLWEYGWYLKEQHPENARPTNYILVTPNGNKIIFNDDKGQITVENQDGNSVQVNSDGVFIGSATGNLQKLLTDLFGLLEMTTTSTSIGPQPFLNVAAYTSLKNTIGTFLTDTKNADS